MKPTPRPPLCSTGGYICACFPIRQGSWKGWWGWKKREKTREQEARNGCKQTLVNFEASRGQTPIEEDCQKLIQKSAWPSYAWCTFFAFKFNNCWRFGTDWPLCCNFVKIWCSPVDKNVLMTQMLHPQRAQFIVCASMTIIEKALIETVNRLCSKVFVIVIQPFYVIYQSFSSFVLKRCLLHLQMKKSLILWKVKFRLLLYMKK